MFERTRSIPSENKHKVPVETLQVGNNLTLKAFPSEHSIEDLPRLLPDFRHELETVDGVILEYFPPEINKIRDSSAIYKILGYVFVPYYEALAAEVNSRNKKVYVFDPAHDLNFGYVMGSTIIGGGGLAYLGKKLMHGLDALKANPEMTRRQHIKKLGLTATGIGIQISGIGSMVHTGEVAMRRPLPIPEPTFRRTIVAKGLRLLDEKLDAENISATLLIAYPPVHWEGIKDLLNHPDRLEHNFALFSQLKKLNPEFNQSFFSKRVYEPRGQNWNLVTSDEI